MLTTQTLKLTKWPLGLIRAFKLNIAFGLLIVSAFASANLAGKALFCETISSSESSSRYKEDHLNTVFIYFKSDNKAEYQQGLEKKKLVQIDTASDLTKINLGETIFGSLIEIDRTTLIAEKGGLAWGKVKMGCSLVTKSKLDDRRKELIAKTTKKFKL